MPIKAPVSKESHAEQSSKRRLARQEGCEAVEMPKTGTGGQVCRGREASLILSLPHTRLKEIVVSAANLSVHF